MDYEEIELEIASIIAGGDDEWGDIPDEFQCQYRETAETILTRLRVSGLLGEVTGNVPWLA